MREFGKGEIRVTPAARRGSCFPFVACRTVARVAAIVLLLGTACSSPGAGSQDGPEERRVPAGRREQDRLAREAMERVQLQAQNLERQLKYLDAFIQALEQFGSQDPEDWQEARNVLRRMEGFQLNPGVGDPRTYEEASDLQLVEWTLETDPTKATAARRELVRRGKMYRLVQVFLKPFHPTRWNLARDEIVMLGEDAKVLLAFTLLTQLMNTDRIRDWEHLRFYLGDLKETGVRVVTAYLEANVEGTWAEGGKEITPSGPVAETPLYSPHRVEQCLLSLIQMGDLGSATVQKMAGHRKPHVRKAVANSIGKAKAVAYLPILEYLVSSEADPDVRSAAALALGRMDVARDRAGPILLLALSREQEATVLDDIAKAVVTLRYDEAVPELIDLLDPRYPYPVNRAAMQALHAFLRPDLQTPRANPRTPAEWKAYWETVKSRWKPLAERSKK